MNFYAYNELIHAIKRTESYNSIELYDSMIYVYRFDDFVVVKDSEKEVFYTQSNFINWKIQKPIIKITTISDKYGPVFHDIFNRKLLTAVTTIQKAWKKRN